MCVFDTGSVLFRTPERETDTWARDTYTENALEPVCKISIVCVLNRDNIINIAVL